jgi:xylitol oxidase
MSTASGRDSLAIHFTWRNEPEAVVALTPRIEAALEPFAPRPHWGKVHTMPVAAIASRYPRFGEFHALVDRADPGGKFRGPWTESLLEVHA